MHRNTSISHKKIEAFLGRGKEPFLSPQTPSPWGGDTVPHVPPLSAPLGLHIDPCYGADFVRDLTSSSKEMMNPVYSSLSVSACLCFMGFYLEINAFIDWLIDNVFTDLDMRGLPITTWPK